MPVLVDVERESYNISPEAIEAAITSKTRAIMPVHLTGNPYDIGAIRQLPVRGLMVVEDSCEAHGAQYRSYKVGCFGHISTFSFFFSHHISTIEGGMVLTNDGRWNDRLRSMRAHGWVRDMSNRDEIAAAHPGIDPRFMFAHVGYNFRPTDIQGAFGIHQLPRLDGLVNVRRANAAYWNEALAPYQEWLMLPSEAPNTRHAHFAYPITVREGAPFTAKALSGWLESNGVETRSIEAGNMARQPAMKGVNFRAEPTPNADYIHDNAFFFGNHHGIGRVEREAIANYFHEFFLPEEAGGHFQREEQI